MSYTRGPKDDYDYWAKVLEDPSWSYEKVLPYFKKSECFHDPSLPADHPLGPRTSRVYRPEYDTFQPEYHGTEGPWKVAYHHFFKSSEGFIRACEAMGIRRNLDPNGDSILGVVRPQTFIQTDGYRSSSSRAFLGDPNVVPGGGDRGTIRIVTKVHVERILLEKRNGVQTAVGVVFRDKHNGKRHVWKMLLWVNFFCSRQNFLIFPSPSQSPCKARGASLRWSISLAHHPSCLGYWPPDP